MVLYIHMYLYNVGKFARWFSTLPNYSWSVWGFVMVLRLPFTCVLWVPTFQTYTSTLHCGNDMCTQCMTSLNLIKRAHLYNLCEFEMDQVFREDVRTTRHLFLVIWLEMV